MDNDNSAMSSSQSEVDNAETDILKLKHEVLSPRIPFIRRMIANFKGHEFERKWQTMLNCVESNKKRMTVEQIHRLDAILSKRQKDSERIKNENESKLKGVKAEAIQMPKPADLGKPVLSLDDLQSLMEDLTNPNSVEEPPMKIIKIEPKPAPKEIEMKTLDLKINAPSKPAMVRLPSSFLSSKITPPRRLRNENDLNSILNAAGIPSSSFTSPFRIPKKSSASSSPNIASSPGGIERNKETSQELKSFDLFATPPNKKMEGRTIDKIKIVRSPSSEKKNFFTVEKSAVGSSLTRVKEPEGFMSDSDLSLDSEAPEDTKEEKEESPEKKVEFKDYQKDKVVSHKPRTTFLLQKRMEKELSRLKEDIVQNDGPLKKRRSCTRKRTISGSQESPTSSEVSLTGDKEVPVPDAKRPKSDLKTTDLPFRVRKPVSPISSGGRVTRKTVQEANVKIAEDTSPSKRSRTERMSEKLEKISKSFDLKQCSIALPAVTVDELKELPVKTKQTARKSTSIDSMPLSKRLTLMRESRSRNKNAQPPILRRTRGMVASNKDKEEDDDEWEDIDDATSASDEPVEKADKEAADSEPDLPQIEPYIYKNICNIAFTYCKSGPIFKCMIQGCRSQTLQKNKFIKHLETQHTSTKWNGYCNVCVKTVEPNNCELSLILEFLHMVEEHLLKEKMKFETTESSGKSSNPEIDTEMMKGIDMILNELSPPLIGGTPDATSKQLAVASEAGKLNNNEKNVADKPIQDPVKEPLIFRLPATTTITTFNKGSKLPSSVVTAAAPVQTKIISKNFVGRVIPISQIPGLKGKLSSINLAKKTITIAQHPKPEACTKTSGESSGKLTKPASNATEKFQAVVNRSIPEPASDLDDIIAHLASKSTTPAQIPVKTSSVYSQLAVSKSKASEPKHELIKLNEVKPAPEKVSRFQQLSAEESIMKNVIVKKMPNPRRFLDRLRPWLEIGTLKNSTAINAMTTPVALTATFKCLGRDCSFYTSDSKTFQVHLSLHSKYTYKDLENFMSCAYCGFIGISSESLISHVTNIHAFDKFQCSYCFYRSCVGLNVVNHQRNFHNTRIRSVLVIAVETRKDYQTELDIVKASRSKFVLPLVCPICANKFFVFKAFLNHVHTHSAAWSSKCGKCGFQTTKGTLQKHIVQCFGYGIYQCVYCCFGTNTFDALTNHLSMKHPTRLPFLCERSENKESKDPEPGQIIPSLSSIESTSLKHVKQNLEPSIFRIAPSLETDAIHLKNVKNVGNVGDFIQLARNETIGVLNSKEIPKLQPSFPYNYRIKIPQAKTITDACDTIQSDEPKSFEPLKLQIMNVFSLAPKPKL